MIRVTLSDVIHRRVALTAREAVTLILAVAKEWDRQRALKRDVSLPAVGAIQLDETGNVFFLVTPGTPNGQSKPSGETLSSLLGRLLGTDEAGTPHPYAASLAAAPGGSADIPAVPDESFRSVLTRFADDDYARIVASVVARTKAAEAQSLDAPPARVRHAGPERRRQPRIVAELRLDIRQLERELFALRAASTRTPPVPPRTARRVTMRVMLGGAAACALALLTIFAIEGNPLRAERSAAVGELPRSYASSDRVMTPVAISPMPAPIETSPVADVAKSSAARTDRPASTTQRRHRQITPSATRSQKRPAATFAGGARSIDWLRH
jgi:hypothetical protein